jgi:polyisoprenoid-binding protein YceI
MLRSLALLTALVVLSTLAAAAEPTRWSIAHEDSRLGFVATWADDPFSGSFERFRADMRFDPERLGESRFAVSVEVASADTRNRDRDREMGRPEWFHFARFPEARFRTSGFRRLGPERYAADGVLTIKDVSRPVTLPFTWRQSDGTARMQGSVVLNRTAFGVGEGEFATGEEVGLEVRVEVDLLLHREGEECPC